MKKWKETTRDGSKVRIYAQDGGGKYPMHGAIWANGIWHPRKWKANGRFSNNETYHPDDLIPDRREVWVNEYPNGVLVGLDDSIEDAKENAGSDLIRTIKFVEVLGDE